MVGFDDLYRQGGAVTWQAGKEDVVHQVVELLMGLGPSGRVLDFGCGTGWTAPILTESGARLIAAIKMHSQPAIKNKPPSGVTGPTNFTALLS